jgi:hypothetical protein
MCNQGRFHIINAYSFEYEYVMNVVECINEIVASKLHCNAGFDTV